MGNKKNIRIQKINYNHNTLASTPPSPTSIIGYPHLLSKSQPLYGKGGGNDP